MMPMRTIGYLLGIPEEDQEKIRDRSVANIKMPEGRNPAEVDANVFADTIAMFAEYIDWRAGHPSDDLCRLLLADIDDQHMQARHAPRLSLTASRQRSIETTVRLIGLGN